VDKDQGLSLADVADRIAAMDPLSGPNLMRYSKTILREDTKPDGTKVLVFSQRVPYRV
jgi:hypothetical protein